MCSVLKVCQSSAKQLEGFTKVRPPLQWLYCGNWAEKRPTSRYTQLSTELFSVTEVCLEIQDLPISCLSQVKINRNNDRKLKWLQGGETFARKTKGKSYPKSHLDWNREERKKAFWLIWSQPVLKDKNQQWFAAGCCGKNKFGKHSSKRQSLIAKVSQGCSATKRTATPTLTESPAHQVCFSNK